MTDNHHEPSPPNRAAGQAKPRNGRRVLRWLLFGLVGLFFAVMLIAVLQATLGLSS